MPSPDSPWCQMCASTAPAGEYWATGASRWQRCADLGHCARQADAARDYNKAADWWLIRKRLINRLDGYPLKDARLRRLNPGELSGIAEIVLCELAADLGISRPGRCWCGIDHQ